MCVCVVKRAYGCAATVKACEESVRVLKASGSEWILKLKWESEGFSACVSEREMKFAAAAAV